MSDDESQDKIVVDEGWKEKSAREMRETEEAEAKSEVPDLKEATFSNELLKALETVRDECHGYILGFVSPMFDLDGQPILDDAGEQRLGGMTVNHGPAPMLHQMMPSVVQATGEYIANQQRAMQAVKAAKVTEGVPSKSTELVEAAGETKRVEGCESE